MITLKGTRFGDIEINEEHAILFPRGLIGFAEETRFVILERPRSHLALLQSLKTPSLAFPVVEARIVDPDYAIGSVRQVADTFHIKFDDLATLFVVHADPNEPHGLRANMLAPILMDAASRRAWQVILDGSGYDAAATIDPSSLALTRRVAHPIVAELAPLL
ncbi:MAG: flagellar assembly protein FliW [Polyangiaceae bacterium]